MFNYFIWSDFENGIFFNKIFNAQLKLISEKTLTKLTHALFPSTQIHTKIYVDVSVNISRKHQPSLHMHVFLIPRPTPKFISM